VNELLDRSLYQGVCGAGQTGRAFSKGSAGPIGNTVIKWSVPCPNAYFTTGRPICKVGVVIVKYDYKKCEL
jgi:hypothetical protein